MGDVSSHALVIDRRDGMSRVLSGSLLEARDGPGITLIAFASTLEP